MGKKTIWRTNLAVAGLLALGTAFAHGAKAEEANIRSGSIRVDRQHEWQLPALAKIDPQQALQAALRAVNGKVLKVELADEDGFLAYGVEIVTPKETTMEVTVDAGTGDILATATDHADNGPDYRQKGAYRHDEENETEED